MQILEGGRGESSHLLSLGWLKFSDTSSNPVRLNTYEATWEIKVYLLVIFAVRMRLTNATKYAFVFLRGSSDKILTSLVGWGI